MAWRLFDAKPLTKPVLTYCQLDPWEQTSVKFESKYKTFHSRKCIWKDHLRNGGHFVKRCVSWTQFHFSIFDIEHILQRSQSSSPIYWLVNWVFSSTGILFPVTTRAVLILFWHVVPNFHQSLLFCLCNRPIDVSTLKFKHCSKKIGEHL